MRFNPAVLIITGGFSLFFLISGVRALVRKRMTVVNPDSPSAWPGLLGSLLVEARKPYDVPMPGGPHLGPHMEATGARAVGMAWLYIVLGVAFLLVGLFHFLMDNDLLSFLFD
ncbi:hypothetical protein [Vitiosangium sp. GDMCC 1.1324]|uniref:hypothetical protein n=1 Tax=Vitiosangium sp. (strain GDMCC 1.1324) TaxID=2138576 RepID=UPI000D3549E6|nr:hypothetical protein [Vitiosangium sp. GDMCC 1.1324]PTL77218.1 hypothetical protein DAT35_45090 [Vitiosangium sp. GDMCC 1.1324]